ncbi:MAG: DNA topoisomerase I [Sulfolobales archaeon]
MKRGSSNESSIENIYRKPRIVIIAEKPKAAYKIAQALGPARRILIEGVPIYVIPKDHNNIIVVPSAGHLFTLTTSSKGYPVYDYKWVPRHLVEKGYEHIARYHRVLPKILRDASLYVNACDYDVEGSVIGYMIIKNWGDLSRARRMKFSTLTREDILRSFQNLDQLDINMVEAGLARHELDWIWGINISRALTDLYQRRGLKRVLSAGRVQTPTLNEVLNRFIEREVFVPEPLYRINIKALYRGSIVEFQDIEEPFRVKVDAEKFRSEALKKGFIDIVESSEQELRYQPPHPFNLGDLQAEAYEIYRITPQETLRILEDLYLEGLISYPRTNSQKLPENLDHKEILRGLLRISEYRRYAEKLIKRGSLKPNNGVKEDLAHPAIYPTGDIPRRSLKDKHYKLYDLIVRRYMATLSDDALVKEIILKGCVAGRCFRASGRSLEFVGWLEIYHFYKIEERRIPYIERGSSIPLSEVKIVKSYTRPPKLYNRASLLRWMEKENIGTESTRAEIIETLFRRKYVFGRELKISELGIEVVEIIERFFPELLSVELTREFEKQLDSIILGKRKRSEVVEEAVKTIDKLIGRFKNEINNTSISSDSGSRCVICNIPRDPSSEIGFCKIHEKAYRNLIRSYSSWAEDGYTWHEYLEKISRSKISGGFVKDVVRYIETHKIPDGFSVYDRKN